MTSDRFNKAYNALVNAFFNGTLAKGTCTACAIGNIVADAMGAEIIRIDEGVSTPYFTCEENNDFWKGIFATNSKFQARYFGRYPQLELRLKSLTDYTHLELAQVEETFERNTRISACDYGWVSEQQALEDQYNGLRAVVDVLLSFEENTTNPIPYKEKFREHPKLA